jgi:hypothetical protein
MTGLIRVISAGIRAHYQVVIACMLLVCSSMATCNAQVKINGGFLADSLKIGEPTAFYLSAHYPAGTTMLFPDSTHRFGLFEFQKKAYFPTDTENGISHDSTVYYLTTFEIDERQGLNLPVYMVNEQDCTVYQSNVDSIRLIQLVAAVPDSIPIDKLPLKINTAYHPVEYGMNYFVLSLIAGGLVIISLIVWIVFGKRIARYFRTRRMEKHHRAFVDSYERIVGEVQNTFTPSKTESALSLWKKYLETLEAKPYTKLTSKETVRVLNDQVVAGDLKAIDRAIYGNESHVSESLRRLRSVADERFARKLKEVKHGK